MDNGNRNDEAFEALPELAAALKQLPSEPIFVPSTVDEAVLKAARQHLCRPERKRTNWFRLLPWTVVSAGLAAAVLLAYPYTKEFLGLGPSRKTASRGWDRHTGTQWQSHGLVDTNEDVNQDGKVDILDAFMLARKLQDSPIFDPHLDMNGDGLIDHRDVEAIAARAVSLNKGNRS